MEAQFDNKPKKLEPFGNGLYLYIFNVEECINISEYREVRHYWKADTVKVYAPLSSNKILKAVLEEYYGQDKELKLINDYNSVMAGMILEEDKETIINRYQDFLAKRLAIKRQIEEDCKELSIK